VARPKDDKKIEAIFEATLKLVQKSGFNGLKMADVAKAAGMATGTLYIYFKNKDVLINELFLSLKRSKTSRMMQGYREDDSFEKNFRTLWFNYLELSLTEPERMLFIEQFAHTSFLTKKTKQQGDQLLEPLISFLETGMQKKIIRKLPVAILLSQLMGPIYEVIKAQQAKEQALTAAQKEGMYEMAWRSVTF
jgi:AcrR family transcriptional regulator